MSMFRSSVVARWHKRSNHAKSASGEPESMAVAGKAGAGVRRRRPRHVGRLLAAAACLVTAVGALVVASPPIEAATLDGVATIASPGTSSYLASGGSQTQFTVSLPAEAACSGDSAHDGYHVYSYLVEQGTNVTSVKFVPPPPSQGYGLVNNIGTYYGQVNTAPNTGQIIEIPNDFEWAPLVTDDNVALSTLLYQDDNDSGVWETGIACANSSGTVSDYWNTEITFTANGSDPTGFVWSAIPGPSGSAVSAFTSASSTAFTEGQSGSFTPTASGNPTPTITESGTLPHGVTFSGGVLSGTPTQTGSFPITFTATNGIGNPATQSFTLAVNSVPAFTSASSTNFTANSFNTFTVSASGVPTPSFTESGGLDGLSFNDNGNGTATLSGTPTATGTFPITFNATNTAGTTPQDFTLTVGFPGAPTIGTATAGNASASVAFTAPASDGGETITSYTVTATDSTTPANGGETASGASSPISVPGLTNGDSYTFTVTATNGVGAGPASAASNAVTPATVPDAPTIGTATPFDASASVTFTAPASDNGSTISSYTVTATDSTTPANGGETASGASSPITVPGLTNGDSYTFTVTATNGVGTGPASEASNAVTPVADPGAPTIGTATPFDASASVSFTAPASDGGSDISSYTVTATDSTTPANGGETASGASSPITVPGLTNGDSYTFTVTATNGVGTGPSSDASNAVTPATVPGAPTIGTATYGNASASVSFTAPASDGGSDISGYTVTATDSTTPTNGGETASGASSPITVSGLTNGDSYTFTVTATNGVGTGSASDASNAVTPDPPGFYITTTSLNPSTATIGQPYSTNLTTEGGTPYIWRITSGALPKGIKLGRHTGVISGTVKIARRNEPATGPYTITVTATDHGRHKQTSPPVNLTLTLDPA
jgi:large repetitive protein